MYTFYFQHVKGKKSGQYKMVAANMPCDGIFDDTLWNIEQVELFSNLNNQGCRVVIDPAPNAIADQSRPAKLQLAPGYKAVYPVTDERAWKGITSSKIPCGQDITSDVIVGACRESADSAKPETRPDPYLECQCNICRESRGEPKIGPLPPQAPLAPEVLEPPAGTMLSPITVSVPTPTTYYYSYVSTGVANAAAPAKTDADIEIYRGAEQAEQRKGFWARVKDWFD